MKWEEKIEIHEINEDVISMVSKRYIELYEKLLGKRFLEPKNKNIIDRIQKNLTNYLV